MLLPAEPPEDAANEPGLDAARAGAAPRRARSASARSSSSSTSRTRRTRSRTASSPVAAAKAQEFGLETLSATSTGNLANAVAARAAALGMRAVIFCPAGLEPEKFQATTVYGATVYGGQGSYDDCSRLVSELAGEVDWGIVNVNLRSYYAEGSKTLAFEIAEQLGWETPDAVVMPIGSGAMYTKIWQGFEQFGRLGLIDGTPPRLYGGQAAGCAPVAAAFAEDRRVTPVRPNTVASSIAIGNPADGDLDDRHRADVRRRDLLRARGRGRREHRAARRDRRHLRRGRDRRRGRRAARGGRAAARSASATASSCSSPAPA